MLRELINFDLCALIVLSFIGLALIKRLSFEFKVLTVFIVYASITDIVTTIQFLFGLHNLYWFNVLSIVEYLVYSYMIFIWLNNKNVLLLIILASLFISVFWFWTTFNIMGFEQYNFYFRMVQSVFMVFFSGILFVNISDFTKKGKFRDAKFWMAISWLMFFSINVIVYVFSGLILKKMNQLTLIGTSIKSAINIFEYLLFAVALLCDAFKQRTNFKNY